MAQKSLPDEIAGVRRRQTGPAAERSGGLLAGYLDSRQEVPLLAQMLAFPVAEEAGEGRQLARFAGLNRDQLAAYVRLAGTVESKEEIPVDLPADLLDDLLSGDQVRVQDAAGRLQSAEPQRDGPKHQAHRSQLLQMIQNPEALAQSRVNAGAALGQIGDGREGVSSREPLLIPITKDLTFLMGDKKQEVTVPAPFAIARYPVTNAQYRFLYRRWRLHREGGGKSAGRRKGADQRKSLTQPRFWDNAHRAAQPARRGRQLVRSGGLCRLAGPA